MNRRAMLLALSVGVFLLVSFSVEPQAQMAVGPLSGVDARIVAVDIPGASAVAQIGTFLNVPLPQACANPIPTKFPSYILPGAVLDPNRILVATQWNFGAPLSPWEPARKGHFCRSIRAAPIHCSSPRPSREAGYRPPPSAAQSRCLAPTAPTR